MFCNHCGQEIPEGSRFCNGCGTAAPAAVAEAGHRPIVRSSATDLDEEHEVFKVRPTMLFVYVRYAIAALVVLAMAALMGWLHYLKESLTNQVGLLVVAATGVIAFAMPVYQHILRRREVYTLTNHKLEMRYGLIARNLRNIPLDKIQDVTVISSVWQRFLRIGDILIDSASETGKIHLDDIPTPERYADMVLAAMRRRN